MTMLMRWLLLAAVVLGPWTAVLSGRYQSDWVEQNRHTVLLYPFALIAAFGVYSVCVIAWRVYSFNDCQEAADELQKRASRRTDSAGESRRPCGDSPVERRPCGDSPVERRRPFEDSPVERRSCGDSPVERRPCGDSPVERRRPPVERRPCGDSPVERRPCGGSPVERRRPPVERRPCGDSPVEKRPCGDSTVERRPCGDSPVSRRPCGDSAVSRRPCGDSPVERRPCGDSAVERRPSGDSPVERRPCVDSPGRPGLSGDTVDDLLACFDRLTVSETADRSAVSSGAAAHIGGSQDLTGSDLEITDPAGYRQRARTLLSGLTLSAADRAALEQRTGDDRPAWLAARRGRITASVFQRVSNLRPGTSCRGLLETLLYGAGSELDLPAMRYGRQHEEHAIGAYQRRTGARVRRPVGLLVHQRLGFLGATPDGWVQALTPDGRLTDGDVILEVKCPQRVENSTLRQAAAAGRGFCLEVLRDGNLRLRRGHAYYSQVQAQMACCGVHLCDFFVWSPQEHHLERIEFDRDFWEEKLPKVREFFLECVLPEMVDPRKARGLPFRERQSYTPRLD